MRTNKNNSFILFHIRRVCESLLLMVFIPFFFLGTASDALVRLYATSDSSSLPTEFETESESDEKASKDKEERAETNDDPKESQKDGGDGNKSPFHSDQLSFDTFFAFSEEYSSLRLNYTQEFSSIKSLFPSLFLLDHSFLE